MSSTTRRRERFSLTEEQAFALAQEGSPAFIPGAFQVAVAQFKAIPKIEQGLAAPGSGLGWHEHDPSLFHGTERFFRPGYAANLVTSWIPALDGVEAQAEGRRAGWPTSAAATAPRRIIMARGVSRTRASSASTTTSRRSSTRARPRARPASPTACASRWRRAQDFPGADYDLVAFFDCLHDMGDPVGAAAHVRASRSKPTAPG